MESIAAKAGEKVPVLLLAFNRPTPTQKVLDEISVYAPPDLYVGIDGARQGRPDDEANGAKIRRNVAAWEAANPGTRVHRLYREHNLGCGRGVSSAITWFFGEQPMGIVLEDDCIPNQSFFAFCQELLHRYTDEERIMHIGGSNQLHGGVSMESTFYFSKYPQIWGWASWQRAWKNYRFDMPDLDGLFRLPAFQRYYKRNIFELTGRGLLDTWDIQWIYAFLMNDGLSILPKGNFIRNIGFDVHEGSHLNARPTWYVDATTEIDDLLAPAAMEPNVAADDYVFRTVYNPSILLRAKRKLKKLLFKKG
jgi:hypothetical protein